MRTSHRRMTRLLHEERSRITDEELFRSRAFAAYLTDIAETATERYRKGIKVKTLYDTDPGAMLACTDNRTITINTGNYITQSFPTRLLKADSLVGLNAHEIGHILYTNFKIADTYFASLQCGRLYPEPQDALSEDEQEALMEMQDFLKNGKSVEVASVLQAAKHILNILEDAYIEAKICYAFPGRFATGITLNNIRFSEMVPSVDEQLKNGNYRFSVFSNLLVQYCLHGDINNRDGYAGEIMDRFLDLLPIVDEAVYDEDMRHRCDATNHILLNIWDYILEMVRDTSEEQQNKNMTDAEAENSLSEKMEGQIVKTGGTPMGKSEPVTVDASEIICGEEKAKLQRIVAEELGRMTLTETEKFGEGENGGITYNNAYEGVGYGYSAEDIERILNFLAEEKAEEKLFDELSQELQNEANALRMGNAHTGVRINVNRMKEVNPSYIKRYEEASPPLIAISRQMQKRLMQVLKDTAYDQKQTGLVMGRRIESRMLMDREGRIFSKKCLPSEKKELAVALLLDESGSMESMDRATYARAAAIIVYDFCKALGVPVMIVGHTEDIDVELYAYTDFDSRDKRDRYRLMDISARCSNRDGAALRFVAERLLKQPEKNKLLMLVSDGQPAGRDGYIGTAAEEDLRGIKKEYTNRGIMFVAAAIGSDKENIERIYGSSFLDISDLTKLPFLLVKKIDRILRG